MHIFRGGLELPASNLRHYMAAKNFSSQTMNTTESSQTALPAPNTDSMEQSLATPLVPAVQPHIPDVRLSLVGYPDITYDTPLLAQMLKLMKESNSTKVDPLTVPNMAGEWPRRGNRNIRTIHNNLSNDDIEYLYRFYHWDMPVCEDYPEDDAKKFRLLILKHNLGSREVDPLLRERDVSFDEVIEILRSNRVLMRANANHRTRTGEFQVLRPIHRLRFTIPNTIAGLEQLSLEKKIALLMAFDTFPPVYLDALLLDLIFMLFGLLYH